MRPGVTRAYGGPVVGGGADTSEGLRARVARGRPNWWVILAVSLGLMALLVATRGSPSGPSRRQAGAHSATAARVSPRTDARRLPAVGTAAQSPPTTGTSAATSPDTTTTTPPASGPIAGSSTHLTAEPDSAGVVAGAASVTTTTTLPPATTTTTTTAQSPSVPADRTQTQGYLNPPVQMSNQYGFTGAGAMDVSVVWSGDTYLTMDVSCPTGGQSVGGTSAMAASLPDAGGSCVATVSEPASETVSLTYTISIGPSSG